MPNKATFTLQLSRKQTQALRDIARGLGYTIRHGPLAGQGSIQQMLDAAADDAVWIIKNPYSSYTKSRRDVVVLMQIADSVERRKLGELAALLRDIASRMD